MIHTFYSYEEDKFLSVDDETDPKKFMELMAEAQSKIKKGLIIIHEGKIQITKI